jgi:aldose 1-epimerase
MEATDPVPAGHKARIERVPFGTAPDGTPVDLFRLTNCHGMVAAITNYGGIVVSLLVPDRQGKLGDVVLGYDTLAGYLAKSPYFGCLVGRYGNRIAKGAFQLERRRESPAWWQDGIRQGGLVGQASIWARGEPAGYAGGVPSREGLGTLSGFP